MSEEKILLLLVFFFVQINCHLYETQPQQIHLSLGDSPCEMVVTWVTLACTKKAFVWYGILSEGITDRADGTTTRFVDEGEYHIVRYVHRVTLPCLRPNSYYVYRCGSLNGLAEPIVFKTRPQGTNCSTRLIVFGDMGVKGAAILPYVLQDVSDYTVDAIVHVGDIAYNMDNYAGITGDLFMKMIQPIASTLPYMTTVGNHEQAYNFSHYKNRFSMPGTSEGLFYSFDMGPAHFVAISTEVYYFLKYGTQQIINQFEWLKKDLKNADLVSNRSKRPWVIVFGHRPMYCSSDTGEDCSFETNYLRCCTFQNKNYGLEDLFHEYHVDLIVSGHMHYYQRSYPIYKNDVWNGSYDDPYKNAKASVHVITGAAGMKSGTERPSFIRTDYFPFFSCEYSYTILTVLNTTHLRLEQVSASRNGEIIDCFYISKH